MSQELEAEPLLEVQGHGSFWNSQRIRQTRKLLDVWASCRWHAITVQIPTYKVELRRVKRNESKVPVLVETGGVDLHGIRSRVPTFEAIFPRRRPGADEEDETDPTEIYLPNCRNVFGSDGKLFGPKAVELAVSEVLESALHGTEGYGDDLGLLLHLYPRCGIYQRSASLSAYRTSGVYKSAAVENGRNYQRDVTRWLHKRHRELLEVVAEAML